MRAFADMTATLTPSLRLDAGTLYDACPFLGLGDHEGIGLGGREHDWHRADVGESHQAIGVGERCIDLAIKSVDDLARRAGRGANARERAHLEAWNSFARQRNVGYGR